MDSLMVKDQRGKHHHPCLCNFSIISAVALTCSIFYFASFLTIENTNIAVHNPFHVQTVNDCKVPCQRDGSEALPKGIISRTSDLEMIKLWSSPISMSEERSFKGLLAMAVGIKQKETVDQIIRKFLSSNITVMLFHYDDAVDQWKYLDWSTTVIHVSASNQTKWWFAKRFLHPDVVSKYRYIFLWDEDINVENFNPDRYISIVEREGLEISQPALDASKSEVHHQITVRSRRTEVHRRIYKFAGGTKCDMNSTSPPCTGWVEMMVPVFSRASWRCVWHLIQNDLIHAWGLDIKLGYCAQGDRTLKVGVVDSEFVVHKGIPSLGGLDVGKGSSEESDKSSQLKNKQHGSTSLNDRYRVRMRSYNEQAIFRRRWQRAVEDDKCWIDPYPQSKTKGRRRTQFN